jgi:hypothetical protein
MGMRSGAERQMEEKVPAIMLSSLEHGPRQEM